MVVVIAVFAAFFVVALLVSILRQDAAAERAATTEDIQNLRAEIDAIRHRVENLETIATAETLDLDIQMNPTPSSDEEASENIPKSRSRQ